MLEFIGFADFANLAEIEPPLPTIEGLPGSVNPLFFGVLPVNWIQATCLFSAIWLFTRRSRTTHSTACLFLISTGWDPTVHWKDWRTSVMMILREDLGVAYGQLTWVTELSMDKKAAKNAAAAISKDTLLPSRNIILQPYWSVSKWPVSVNNWLQFVTELSEN